MKKTVKVTSRDMGWDAFMETVKVIKKQAPKVKVGVLADSSKGSKERDGGVTNAELAAIHEFGTKNGSIPSRSFIRSTFDEQREELLKMTKDLVVAIPFGLMTIDRALNILGAKLAAEIKKKVTEGAGVTPDISQATKDAKGSDRPLVDTGKMIGAVSWAIMRKDEEGGGGDHG